MTWDYQHAYPGGPMVAVRGFPRPLYPPDVSASSGHEPSSDGPDVEAYKRTVSRAGRWPWQAYDQAYSNAFAHGKGGGNVGDSGVEGVQRQQHVQASGWIGTDTFNTLRSIIIPDGLPHAGEHAMDARSVELINVAWDRFKGSDQPPPSGGSAATARLDRARSQLGAKESPANSNMTKYGEWYGANGQPWCAMFVTWADQTGGRPTSTFVRGSNYAYVPYIVNDARLGENGLHVVSTPKPGDLVCYDWSRDGEYDHVGIFESGSASSWNAIEANTSTSDNSNGGQVMRRARRSSEAAVVFCRVEA